MPLVRVAGQSKMDESKLMSAEECARLILHAVEKNPHDDVYG
jgi:hypothetical protein